MAMNFHISRLRIEIATVLWLLSIYQVIIIFVTLTPVSDTRVHVKKKKKNEGYSKITTLLTDLYGDAGGAKVRELLNLSFERIIDVVHNRNGSVVKFAGDSVIVTWYCIRLQSGQIKNSNVKFVGMLLYQITFKILMQRALTP